MNNIGTPHGPLATPTSLTPEGFAYFHDRLAEWKDQPIKLLYSSNKKLHRVAVKRHGHDDTNHACRVGFFRAVRKFDPSLGNAFSTYAVHWVKKEVRELVFGRRRVDHTGISRGEFEIDRRMERIDRHGCVDGIGLPCQRADDAAYQQDGERVARKWLNEKLNLRNATIVYDFLIDDYWLQEIADRYGVSRQCIHQKVEAAKKKLAFTAKRYEDRLAG